MNHSRRGERARYFVMANGGYLREEFLIGMGRHNVTTTAKMLLGGGANIDLYRFYLS